MEGCKMPSPIRSLTDNRIEHAGRTALVAGGAPSSRRTTALVLVSATATLALVPLGAVLMHVLSAGHAAIVPVSRSVGASSSVSRSARASSQELSLLPATAQAPVSRALGGADPQYRVSAVSGGFQALNRRQRLRVRFADADAD